MLALGSQIVPRLIAIILLNSGSSIVPNFRKFFFFFDSALCYAILFSSI